MPPTKNLKVAKLIMVNPDNEGVQNNKFYDMVENGDGTFTATWGRVGQRSSEKKYDMSLWDRKYGEKSRKGYTDQTDLFAVKTTSNKFADIKDSKISRLIDQLQKFAKRSVADNYTVTSDAVTKKQVSVAQDILDNIVGMIAVGKKSRPINSDLVELFKTIPRKMNNVNDYLIDFDKIRNNNDVKVINKIIDREQSLLDTMHGQIKVGAAKKDQDPNSSQTILEAMGLEIFNTDSKDVSKIKKCLKGCPASYSSSFIVVNKKTQDRFDKFVKNSKNKKTGLFWHGSRNENWWSILETGLLLRPTNAVITGKMFGSGSYMSSVARKSYGYTSGYGSYWASGSSNKAFMALFNIHLGNMLIVKRHGSWCYNLTYKNLKKKGDYDSVFAPAGADLRNPENIVYREEQSTIKYLVELKS